MADISVDEATYDIQIIGGDVVFTSDTDFRETMRQRIKAVLLVFLGEWFLDDPDEPQVGVPYFQALFLEKIPTIDVADAVFRQVLLAIPDVTAVIELTFDHERSIRKLDVTYKVNITDDGEVLEDIINFPN